jgi:SAM-dependent methyltransferase
MIDFWNERYRSQDYAYGLEPNAFYKQKIQQIKPGKILFPAEGEGRNAIYAARLGFDVVAFDPSMEGKTKALQLADKHHVKIDYRVESYESIQFKENSFDILVLIFAHMPAQLRKEYHQKMLNFLKPGGTLILEGFSKEQIEKDTGGPKDHSMLFSAKELKTDFETLTSIKISCKDVVLNEGPYHQGVASVIQLVGKK